MNPAAYLDRVGVPRERADADAPLDLLADLQHAHVTSVPFENLDVISGRPIELDRAAFYEKVVARGRGGFCYELNGLFEWLLGELGFETTIVSGRVAREDGSLGPAFDHLAVLVDIDDGRYLADVGFGEFARRPLPLDGDPRSDASGEYRVQRADGAAGDAAVGDGATGEADEATPYVAESRVDADDAWATEYRFIDRPRDLGEFAGACEHHQTAAESPFTGGPLVTMATETGRVTLSADTLAVTDRGEKRKQPVASNSEWERALAEYFGMRL